MYLPYAISDFTRLRKEGFFYADKTRFIPLLEDKQRGRSYVLFLRPRRLGKSTLREQLEQEARKQRQERQEAERAAAEREEAQEPVVAPTPTHQVPADACGQRGHSRASGPAQLHRW